jgi:hypothetical protein
LARALFVNPIMVN